MRRILSFALLLVSAGLLVTCNDKSSNPVDQTVVGSFHQIGGCGYSTTARVFAYDSCFAYEFKDTLITDFCLPGNCCPDSNRFVLSYEVRNDTIFVAASDTAENLCRCTCNYIFRAEFANLPLNHYVFHCMAGEYPDLELLYEMQVYKPGT
ncbi:MAG TPA: hypothetical protein VIS48_12405 [Candidatus Kryptonia bacterium]